jgi:sodium/bile acid cotransporter 7
MLKRLLPDPFILLLLSVVLGASLFPAQGRGLAVAGTVSNSAIFLLFFLHGLRLAHGAVLDGVRHWRLQLAILFCTFGIVPLLGLSASFAWPGLLSPALWVGIFFLCVLPSTVQASIASSSVAGGNVAASIIGSATSNLIAVLLTPLLFSALAHFGGVAMGLGGVAKIASLLLAPFALGQIAQRWLGAWALRHKAWLGRLDKLTIMLTLYVAFSAAANDGIWGQLRARDMAALAAFVLLLLVAALASCWLLGRSLGFSREDRITLLFSGAHKSLATGAPMARILFPGATAGLIIVPLMLYHQLQLIVSAWLAVRLAPANTDAHDQSEKDPRHA